MDFNPKDQTRFDPVITEAQSQAWLKVLSSSYYYTFSLYKVKF